MYLILCGLTLVVGFFILRYINKRKKEKEMPAGLQIYNEQGQLTFDSTGANRYFRVLGKFVVDGIKGHRMVVESVKNVQPVTHDFSRYFKNGGNLFAIATGAPADTSDLFQFIINIDQERKTITCINEKNYPVTVYFGSF